MPEFDSSKITAIVALAAIISPVLTTIINLVFQVLSKKAELKEKRYQETVVYKKNIFENYITSCSKYISSGELADEKSYRHFYYLALLYLPNELRTELEKIEEILQEQRFRSAQNYIVKLIPKLKEYIDKL